MVFKKTAVIIISALFVLQASASFNACSAAEEYYGEYLVGPNDQLSIMEDGRQYSILVAQSGYINLPGIGFIYVLGKRLETIQSEINKLQDHPDIKGEIKGRPLTINLAAKSNEDVSVLGCFNKIGSQAVNRLSIIESNAGDVTASSNGDIIVYYPDAKNRPITYKIGKFKKGKPMGETDPWIPRGSVVIAKSSPIKSFFNGKAINIIYTILATSVLVMAINNNTKK